MSICEVLREAGVYLLSVKVDWSFADVLFSLRDLRSLIQDRSAMPAIMPVRRASTMTMAREDSKCQKKKETATGAAFCTEKAATTATMMKTKMSVIMLPPDKSFSRRTKERKPPATLLI
jgi:hypothetical protein